MIPFLSPVVDIIACHVSETLQDAEVKKVPELPLLYDRVKGVCVSTLSFSR